MCFPRNRVLFCFPLFCFVSFEFTSALVVFLFWTLLISFRLPKFSFSSNNINNQHLIRRNITLHFGGDGVDTIIIFDGDRGTASWFDLTLEERKQQQRSKTSAASTRAARFDQTSLGAHDPVALMLQPVSDSNRFYSWNSFRARFDPSLRQMFAHSLNFVYLEDDESHHFSCAAHCLMLISSDFNMSNWIWMGFAYAQPMSPLVI